MRQYFSYAVILFTAVYIGAWASRSFGWYNEYAFTDIMLHIVSGAAFGLMWLGFMKDSRNQFWVICIGGMSFATFGSVMWEFWEFAGWRVTPSQLRFYIPELGDTLGDILCGMIGGAVVSLLSRRGS